jgi:hypothetical protein
MTPVDVFVDPYRSLGAAEWLDKMDRNALTYLGELNRNMDGVFTMLDKLNGYPELEKDYFLILKATLREQLANINTTAMSALEESEQKELFVAYTQRMAYEKEIRDPDDCYLMVLEREKELQRQGQPSRIGILLGMRHVTRDEILSGSFAAEAEDPEADQDEQTEDEEDSDDASE